MLNTDRKDDGGREGPAPFDYPSIHNPSVTYDSDQDKVSIVGQAVYPDSARVSGVSVRLSMSSESAMRLMRLLQRLHQDEGFDMPSGRLYVVESAEALPRPRSQAAKSWLALLVAILPKRRGR